MTFPSIHRVVTGHDANGDAIVATDGPLPTVIELQAVPGTVFHEVWCTATTPAWIDNGPDPTTGALALAPPKHGTRVRFVDFPPETQSVLSVAADQIRVGFAQVGGAQASTARPAAPHPFMHRTQTVDYGVVIEGEITLVVDKGEVQLRPGSVVVQRGTNHAWANRSGKPCRMLFVLVDGDYDPAIAQALASRG